MVIFSPCGVEFEVHWIFVLVQLQQDHSKQHLWRLLGRVKRLWEHQQHLLPLRRCVVAQHFVLLMLLHQCQLPGATLQPLQHKHRLLWPWWRPPHSIWPVQLAEPKHNNHNAKWKETSADRDQLRREPSSGAATEEGEYEKVGKQRSRANPGEGHQRSPQGARLCLHDTHAGWQTSDKAGNPQCGRWGHLRAGAPGAREEPEPESFLPERRGEVWVPGCKLLPALYCSSSVTSFSDEVLGFQQTFGYLCSFCLKSTLPFSFT